MTIDENIKDEKLQYDITREVTEKSTLSSTKLINISILQMKKYYILIKEYLISDEILNSDHVRMIN